jgi:hypothetical protein
MNTTPPYSVNPEIDRFYAEKKWRMYVQALDAYLEKNKTLIVSSYSFRSTKTEIPEECYKVIKALLNVLNTSYEFSHRLQIRYSQTHKESGEKQILKTCGLSAATVCLSLLCPVATPFICVGAFAVGLLYGNSITKIDSRLQSLATMVNTCKDAEKELNSENIIGYLCKFKFTGTTLDSIFDLAMGYKMLPEDELAKCRAAGYDAMDIIATKL